jgi:mannitol/fructose-specific phosphotransferase system IIA component (Ntr-type)
MKLTEIVAREAIVVPLKSTDRDEVVAELIDAVATTLNATPELRNDLLARVLLREKKGSTGFGKGVAVPHVKHPQVKRMRAALGVSPRGVDFNALDKQPVFSVMLLLSPENQPEEHLQAMEVIFKNVSKETFRRFLRQATGPDDVWALLEEADAQLMA